MEFNKVNNYKWVSGAQGSVYYSARVQEQGMIMILARVFVPTVATFLPQPRVLSSPNTALTTLSQKSSSALIQVSSHCFQKG